MRKKAFWKKPCPCLRTLRPPPVYSLLVVVGPHLSLAFQIRSSERGMPTELVCTHILHSLYMYITSQQVQMYMNMNMNVCIRISCLYHVRMYINIPRTTCNSGYSWPADAPKCNKLTQKESYEGRTYSSWWFQPIWKTLVSQIASFRQVGLNIKHMWNHHPVICRPLFSGSIISFNNLPRNCASIKLCSWSLKGGVNFREVFHGNPKCQHVIPDIRLMVQKSG